MALNGGMFKSGYIPLGLYVEGRQKYTELNNGTGNGNYYLGQKGIFFVTGRGKADVQPSTKSLPKDLLYATQSGPMLLVNGTIEKNFPSSSLNKNIRSGVGTLANGKVLFAISRRPITFYELAAYLKKAGCVNAMYLDGIISSLYYPSKGFTKNNQYPFGVIIAIEEPLKNKFQKYDTSN
ncbi:phosphodiester glycosidase family protein [Pedobacter sp. WC2501]|uniref:phosphodiester glycosidase family protein n=1 Tax=Pedobacter sp. WC2501 TaxID=3461400 RepID=UPI00404594E0